MAWLSESVATFTLPHDRTTTLQLLLARLQALGFRAEAATDASGAPLIVARCLTMCANLLVWRCWSDKLVFAVEGRAPHGTIVTVTAIPNLLRVRVKAGETLTDVGRLLSALQAA